jgi:enterochelin esterase-like enzyme
MHEIDDGIWSVKLRFAPEGEFERVHLAGEFLGWDPEGREMLDEDGDGVYETTVELPTGRHVYKFTLDIGEQWLSDPLNPHRSQDGYGNSILYVGVDPEDYPEDHEPPPPPEPDRPWLPTDQQTEPTRRDDPNVSFSLRDDGYDEVSVTGDFNGWTGQLDQMERDAASERWTLALRLDEPLWSRYRFVIRRGDEVFTIHDPESAHISFDGHPMDSVIFTSGADRGVVEILTESLPASGPAFEARTVWVWLPPTYFTEPDRRFPVVIMHDGQNVFDDPVEPFGHGGWHVNTTAEEMIAEGRIEPFILVAVPCNGEMRMEEYGMGEGVMDASQHPYARYLIDDVLPIVTERYRTLTGPESTSVMGSSMGGIISFYLAYHHPEIFGQAACVSSAFMIDDAMEQTLLDLVRAEGKRPIRLYLDSGTAGEYEDGAHLTREMRDLLIESGWVLGDDLVWHQEEGAAHTERAWRARVWRPLEFLFGER